MSTKDTGKSFEQKKKDFATKIGKKIKHYRTERSETLRSLASRINYTAGYIGLLEQGQNVPNTFIISEIADALGYPMSFFFGEEEILEGLGDLQDPILAKKENKEYLEVTKQAILSGISAKKIQMTLDFLQDSQKDDKKDDKKEE